MNEVRQLGPEGNVEGFIPRACIVHRADGPWLSMQCPKFGRCEVPVTSGPACEDSVRGRLWHWEGDEMAPTVTPSVGCDVAPRCGQHRVITAGAW